MEARLTVCFAPCPVVFDLDGTLIDSAPDIHACVNAVLNDAKEPPLTLDEVRRFIGGGVEALWRNVMDVRPLQGLRLADLVSAFMTRYVDAHDLTQVFPGVPDMLDVLADRRHPLGICTNKPLAVTQAALVRCGLSDLFACVIGGDSTPHRKPHPAPLLAALAALGTDPRRPQALYVGDSEYDATCAAAIPVPFLLYTQGYRRSAPSALVHAAAFDDFRQLPALIERWSPAVRLPVGQA